MHIHLASKLVIVVVVVGCLSACTSSGALRMTQPQSQGIAPGRTASLAVEPDVAEPQPIHQEVAGRVRDRLATKLVAAGIFKAVVRSPEPADYSMDVKIRGARQVSPVLRVLLGAMAGPNTLASVVHVQDRRTNQWVAGFEVTGTSASHPLSPHADLDDAVREAVDKMIQALR
jgi:Domain of unknown function (DUF4410)